MLVAVAFVALVGFYFFAELFFFLLNNIYTLFCSEDKRKLFCTAAEQSTYRIAPGGSDTWLLGTPYAGERFDYISREAYRWVLCPPCSQPLTGDLLRVDSYCTHSRAKKKKSIKTGVVFVHGLRVDAVCGSLSFSASTFASHQRDKTNAYTFLFGAYPMIKKLIIC